MENWGKRENNIFKVSYTCKSASLYLRQWHMKRVLSNLEIYHQQNNYTTPGNSVNKNSRSNFSNKNDNVSVVNDSISLQKQIPDSRYQQLASDPQISSTEEALHHQKLHQRCLLAWSNDITQSSSSSNNYPLGNETLSLSSLSERGS